MRYLTDYHVHTNYSFDSDYSQEDMVRAAVALGVKELAFTDHADFCYKNGKPTGRMIKEIDFKRYLNELEFLREKYDGKIKLIFGIELGVGSAAKDAVNAYIAAQPFEFVIGSLHDYAGVDFYYPEFYTGKTKRQAYEDYFTEMKRVAETVNGFHVFGHLDYIERYGRFEDKSLDYDEFREVIDGALTAIIDSGRGIEVNTSGFRYGLNKPHPGFKIIKRFKQLGGEIITLGSDAHTIADICGDFKKARQCLLEAGFKAAAVYREGRPVFVDL